MIVSNKSKRNWRNKKKEVIIKWKIIINNKILCIYFKIFNMINKFMK